MKKKKEESLPQTQVGDEAYRMIFENAGDSIFIHDEDKILAVNAKACELLGYTKDELLSMEPSSIDAYEEKANMPGRVARLKARGTLNFETIHQRKDGTPVSVDVTAKLISWKGKTAVMSICRDITRRKHAENILLTTALEWQTTFDSVRDVIFLLDAEFKILRCNKAASEMFGNPGRDLLGKKCCEVVHGTAEPISECPTVRMKKSKKREVSVIKSKDRWLEITADPILDEEGGISGVIHIVSDITDLRKKDIELASSYERFKLILESSSEGIIIADIKTRTIKYSNPAICRMLGYGADEFCNMSIQKIHPADDWPHVLSEFEVQGRGEKILAPDIPCLCKDGRIIYADINTTNLILDGEKCNVGFFRDVTGRKIAEGEIKRSFSLLNATLESTTDGILVVDNAGKIIYSNSKFARMWNIPQGIMDSGNDDQALSHVLQQLRNPELFLNKVKYLYTHPGENSFDVIEFSDGRIFERYSQPQRIDGKPVGRVWSFRDVTMSRKAAEFLDSSERKYKSLVETTNTGYVVLDMEGRVLDANREYIRLAGKNELKEILGRKVTDWTADYERDKNAKAVEKCAIDGCVRNLEIDYVDSSGKITPIEINATVIKSEEGQRILTICRDITKRRKDLDELQKHRVHLEELVEERTSALKESEKKYRELVENTNSIILRMDNMGKVTFFNEFAQSFFGFSREEIIGQSVVGTIVPSVNSNGADLEEMILGIGRNPEKFRNNLNENMRKNGERAWIAWTNKPIFDGNGQVAEIMCVGNDITDRVKAEEELDKYRNSLEELVEERTEELRKKEEYLSKAQHIAHLGSWNRDMLTGELSWSDESRRIFGLADDEPVTYDGFMEFIHPEDVEKLKNAQIKMREGREPVHVEYRIIRKSGEIRHIYQKCESVFDANRKLTNLDGIVLDITDRRNVELALLESEARFRKILEKAPISMAIVGMDGTIEYINRKAVGTFGYPHEDIPNMDRWYVQAYPDEKYRKAVIATWAGLVEKAISGKHEIEGREYRVTCKDGTEKMVFIFGVPVSDKIFVMFDDITGRKRMEQALRDSEERFRTLFENSRDALMTLSPPSWKFTSANPAIAEMFGVKTIDEFIRHAPWELSPERQPDGRMSVEKAKEMIDLAVRNGYNFFEWSHRRINGEEFPATVLLSRVKIKDELILQATVRDISSQKKTEKEREKLEERLRQSEK
ncbi:MAG: PAS domain S-box protein, partial [Victivallales bacterium]